MKKWLLSLIAISAILTGCNGESKENTSNANTLTQVEAFGVKGQKINHRR